MKTNTILQGDALEKLKELPEESINCVMTSPPYWALRDYGVDGQLGLEPTFEGYINRLCDIFDQVKRVLRKDGTCWVNLGDSYNNSGWANRETRLDKKLYSKVQGTHSGRGVQTNYPDKCLAMIPQRFAIEMVNRGWILRNTIIWHKPNCMPSSVKDRFTVDFEYIFFFTKNKKYWFETQRESHLSSSIKRIDAGFNENQDFDYTKRKVKWKKSLMKGQQAQVRKNHDMHYDGTGYSKEGRNKRTVWRICPKPFKEAHFAVYPEELCETPIKAGCPKDGIVLDPFFGAGTTGIVALKQKKKFIGIELNPEYVKIAKVRIKPYMEQTLF